MRATHRARMLMTGALLAVLAAGGCSRAPRPAAAVGEPPVFPVVGDTSEVLSTIPEPVAHPRPAAVVQAEASDTSDALNPPEGGPPEATDSASQPRADSDSLTPAPPPPGSAAATAAPAGPAGTHPAEPGSDANPDSRPGAPVQGRPGPPPAPPASSAQLWRVQIFASTDRAAAYREAQRATRTLNLRDDEIAMILEGRLWKVRAGSPGPREQAQALLAKARAAFPKAFLSPESGGEGPR